MFDDSFKSRYTTIPYALYVLDDSDAEYTLPPHNHKEVEFIAVTCGEVDFHLNTVTYSLSAGDVLVIPPYCIHGAKIPPHSSYDCICFDLSIISDEKLRSELEYGKLTVCRSLCRDYSYTKSVHEHIRGTVSAFKSQQDGWELEVLGRLSLVFSTLRQENFFVQSGETKDDRFCRSVVEYIAKNYGESITSTSLANELYMNNSYFCRLFKKHFHCNFSDFINAYRIEKAKSYLADSKLSVSEVVTKCGFNSFSYFCKIFKAHTGVCPTAYRSNSNFNLPL